MTTPPPTWIELEVQRLLFVDRGREIILCDRGNMPNGGTLVVKMSDEAKQKLLAMLTAAKG